MALTYWKKATMALHLHIIVLAVLAVASTLYLVLAQRRFRSEWAKKEGKTNPKYRLLTYDKDDLPSFWARGVAYLVAPFMVLALLISLIPFSPAYWFLTPYEGEISTISNRFVEGSGDVSGSTYTLTLVGDPTPRVVTDSRILGLSVGDHVNLTCSLEWVYGGADINNCFLRSF